MTVLKIIRGVKVHISRFRSRNKKTIAHHADQDFPGRFCWTLWRRHRAWNRPGCGYGSLSSSTAPMWIVTLGHFSGDGTVDPSPPQFHRTYGWRRSVTSRAGTMFTGEILGTMKPHVGIGSPPKLLSSLLLLFPV